MNKIYCPVCESELVVTHQDRYESLSEHVSNPNGVPSMKDGYECVNPKCLIHRYNIVWTEDGAYYFGELPEGLGYFDVKQDIESKSISGTCDARNSWEESYNIQVTRTSEETIRINLFFIKLQIEPIYHQLELTTPGYSWKHVGKKWNWFIRRSGDYIGFSPIWEIIKFKNDDFKYHYPKAMDGDYNSILMVFKFINDRPYWSDNGRENRFWYLVGNQILRIWYKKEMKNILNKAEEVVGEWKKK